MRQITHLCHTHFLFRKILQENGWMIFHDSFCIEKAVVQNILENIVKHGQVGFTYYVITFCLFQDPSSLRNQIQYWMKQKLHKRNHS